MNRFIDARQIFAIALAMAIGALLADGQAAQSQTDQQPTATFRSSVEAVQITAIVTDAEGNPVAGLTQDDFEISENRVPRPITTFKAVDIPIERTERSIAESDVLGNERPPGRLYLIALDAMTAENALRARAFLRQFIERNFGPNDTAAVVLTTRGPRESGQDFTSNSRLLLNAIDKFGGDSADEWSARMRERNFNGDFRALMAFMATLPFGRKAVILVSQDIPVDPFVVIDSRPGRLGGIFSEVEPDFIEALSFATRNNIAIYPIDPAGLTTDFGGLEGLETRTRLSGLAAVTGGFSLIGSNNYAGAFERLVRENSTYYVLGFNSAEERRDGRYTRIEVRVKRPGLQVRTVDGYVAPFGKPQLQRKAPGVLAAVWDAVASAITTSGVPMRMYAAPFRGRGKDATVAITLEIAATKMNLIEREGAYRGELEIVFAVTDAKNKRHPIWRHRATVALKPETYERVSHSALRVVSQLKLPEGRYQLRASAGGAAVAGSVVYDMEVPDFREDLSMSGIALTSSQARETFTVSPHAKIDANLPWAPTTAREFSQDDTVTLFTEVYENRRKPHTVTFTIELRNTAGRVIGTQVSERKAATKPKDVSVYSFAPNLLLEEVPPGRYVLHVDVQSSLDKRGSLTRDIPITVRANGT